MGWQVPRPTRPRKGCLRAQAQGGGRSLGVWGKTVAELGLANKHFLHLVTGDQQLSPINDHKHDGDWGASVSALSWVNKGKGVLKCALFQNKWMNGILLSSLDVSRNTGFREDSTLSPDTYEQPVSSSALRAFPYSSLRFQQM